MNFHGSRKMLSTSLQEDVKALVEAVHAEHEKSGEDLSMFLANLELDNLFYLEDIDVYGQVAFILFDASIRRVKERKLQCVLVLLYLLKTLSKANNHSCYVDVPRSIFTEFTGVLVGCYEARLEFSRECLSLFFCLKQNILSVCIDATEPLGNEDLEEVEGEIRHLEDQVEIIRKKIDELDRQDPLERKFFEH